MNEFFKLNRYKLCMMLVLFLILPYISYNSCENKICEPVSSSLIVIILGILSSNAGLNIATPITGLLVLIISYGLSLFIFYLYKLRKYF